ncbi:hypothetical protein GC173_10495 [bacterium]|nr:hypothetical protein [bacterium]
MSDTIAKRTGEVICVLMAITLVIQPISQLLSGLIDWQFTDPATNLLGWYRASLQERAVSWLWPSAWLVWWTMRGDVIRSWFVLTLLVFVAVGPPKVSFWEAGVYTNGERWLIGLMAWYKVIAKHATVAALAVASVRWQPILPPAVLISGLWIFI